MSRPKNPCSHPKACNVLWYYHVAGLNQTQTAIAAELNVGTVNHIVHRRRYRTAYPVPPSNS